MFETHKRNVGLLGSSFTTFALIYHSTVRHIRKSNGNAVIALIVNVMQGLVMVLVFYLMFQILGRDNVKIPGANFVVYLMFGIFLFLTHNKAVSAVAGAEGSTSSMMLHEPMNTAITIISAALSCLYTQLLSILVVLGVYYVAVEPFTVEEPIGAFAMLLAAWFSGCVIGLIFMALKPWAPGIIGMIQQLYTRANMITSGKMFVANTLPSFMIAMFDWNPLFHCIDQARGFAFLNYTPRVTSAEYPFYLSLSLITLGMLGEFYTRKYASSSWGAGR